MAEYLFPATDTDRLAYRRVGNDIVADDPGTVVDVYLDEPLTQPATVKHATGDPVTPGNPLRVDNASRWPRLIGPDEVKRLWISIGGGPATEIIADVQAQVAELAERVTDVEDEVAGPPNTHASTHATAGSDPVTPGAIGAATAGHTHSGTYSPVGHGHAESDVTGLVTDLAGKLAASANLSDLASASTARTNLGLGAAATSPLADAAPPAVAASGAAGVSTDVAREDHTHAGASTDHSASHEPGGSDPMAVDAAATVGSLRTLGTGALQAAAGNAAPNAHAASHASAGSDPVTPAAIGAVPARNERAVRLSTLPALANGEWNYSGVPFQCDPVTTAGGVQYAVWWGTTGKPLIAKRSVPGGVWSAAFDLSTVAGNPLASPVAADGHNVLSVGVDSNGRVHVAGNMHGHALRYAVSTSPGDITAWAAGTMVGADETSCTYPVFTVLPTGTLLFWYRDGVSGDGDLVLNRYNATTQTWSRLGKVIDGKVSDESPYWNRPAVDSAGNVHLFWCWRGTGTANTNNDLCYMKLTGLTGTLSAVRSTGAAQTLPATHANAETVLDTAATGSGLVNTHGADVDTAGRPHTSTWLYDGSGNTQVQHVWHDGGAWHVDQVTNLTQRIDLNVGTISTALSRTHVVCNALGRTYVVYRCNYDGRRGTVRMIDVTGGPAVAEFPIVRLDLGEWEPSIDSRAARERDELVMLVVPLTANGPDATTNPADNWNSQYAGVVTVDMAQMPLVAAGTDLPALRPLSAQNGPPAGVTVTSTTAADFTHGPILVPEMPGSTLFVRASARLKGLAAGTSCTAKILENREYPSQLQRTFGSMVSGTGGASDIRATPWMPLTAFSVSGYLGWVVLQALKTGASNGQVSIGRLDLAVLDGT